MDQFSVELATSIIHLEMQKEQILREDKINKNLCLCRKRILSNYINVSQLFFIRFTGKIIKFMEDMDVLKTMTIDDLHEWYGVEMYDKLYHKKCMSNKMVLLFKLLQKDADEIFFMQFYEKFQTLLELFAGSPQTIFKQEVCSVYSDILEWMENHILGILSIKIDCEYISERLLVDYPEAIGNARQKDCRDSVCGQCFHKDSLCPKKAGLDELELTPEAIHIYMTPELIENGKWITDYLGLILKYHLHPTNIDITLDFVLFEEADVVFDEVMLNGLKFVLRHFKSISLENWQNVYLGEYYDDVVPFLGATNGAK